MRTAVIRQVIGGGFLDKRFNNSVDVAGLLRSPPRRELLRNDSVVYTDTLRRLTPFQAQFINRIYGDPRCCSVNKPGAPKEGWCSTRRTACLLAVGVLKLFPAISARSYQSPTTPLRAYWREGWLGIAVIKIQAADRSSSDLPHLRGELPSRGTDGIRSSPV